MRGISCRTVSSPKKEGGWGKQQINQLWTCEVVQPVG